MALRPAIFLDKDGTVIEDEPYNVDPEKMKLAPGALEGLQALAQLNVPLIVVSNQSGLALGRFDEAGLERMQRRLKEMFQEAGAALAGFHFCPHHPEGTVAPFARQCSCRKPAPGMLLEAARHHGVDPKASWMIGDILNDVEAGRRAGCTTVLIDNGNETEWVMNPWREPHHLSPDLGHAARVVVGAMHGTEALAP